MKKNSEWSKLFEPFFSFQCQFGHGVFLHFIHEKKTGNNTNFFIKVFILFVYWVYFFEDNFFFTFPLADVVDKKTGWLSIKLNISIYEIWPKNIYIHNSDLFIPFGVERNYNKLSIFCTFFSVLHFFLLFFLWLWKEKVEDQEFQYSDLEFFFSKRAFPHLYLTHGKKKWPFLSKYWTFYFSCMIE